jgi:Flp pilus assembly protein TadG
MDEVVAFLRDERGAQTVELVLWLPIIVALLLVVVEISTIYLTHTEMQTVARDTARRMVSGQIRSEAEARSYAVSAMSMRKDLYTVEATHDSTDAMEVAIAVNYADVLVVGFGFYTISGGKLTARVSMPSAPDSAFALGTSASGGTSHGDNDDRNGNSKGRGVGKDSGNGNGNGNGKK